MTSDLHALLVMLVVFWAAWWLLTIIAKRSYVPVIPVYPLVLFGLGWSLNKLYPWTGTCAVAAVHLLLVAMMIRNALRRPSRNNGRPPT